MDKKSLWICIGLFLVSLALGYGTSSFVKLFVDNNDDVVDNVDVDEREDEQLENNEMDEVVDNGSEDVNEEGDEKFDSSIDPELSDLVVEKYNKDTGAVELYINNKRVQFEDKGMDYAISIVKKMNDNIFIVEKELGSSSLYVVNSDAKVIGVFTTDDGDYYKKTTILPTQGYYRDTYRIEGNSIYVQTDLFGNGGEDYTVCNTITNDSDVVVYEEKFEYVGNNKFSTPVVTKKITRKQYMNENNIVCK